MIHKLALATVAAAAFAAPVFAAEQTFPETDAAIVARAELTLAANANQVTKLLASQGYTNVAILGRDDDGRWTGIATKDGQQRLIAVALPHPVQEPVIN